MKDLLRTIVFVLILIISAPLPLVGGLLFIICQAVGLTDIKL